MNCHLGYLKFVLNLKQGDDNLEIQFSTLRLIALLRTGPYLCFFFFELFFLSLREGDLLSDLDRTSK